MRFTKFHISAFRGIKELSFDFAGNPDLNITTLVGLNESGKTTVLEAINYLQNGVEKTDAYKLIPRDQSANFTGDVSVTGYLTLDDNDRDKIDHFCKKLDFYLASPIQQLSYERRYTFKNSEPVEMKVYWSIDLNGRVSKRSKRNAALFTADRERWTKVVNHVSAELMPKVIYYPNFLFDFPEKIYLDAQTEQGKSAQQVLYRRILQDILDSIGGGLDLEEHIHSRLKGTSQSQRSSLDATLLKISTSITVNVIKPWDSIFKSTENKEVIVQWGVDGEGESARYFLTLNLRQGQELYQIDERSLGFKWFFSFLLFTEYRNNRSTDPGETLFLIDEPASNLHSTMQEKLVEKLEAIVNKSRLVYTTHSHHLINPLWLESTFIVLNKAINYSKEIELGSRQTDIDVVAYRVFAAKHPDQRDYFQPILDTLDYKPSKLEMVPDIIIVEGKNDFYTLKYMFDIVLSISNDFGLYPGNGAKGNSQAIALYIAWARNFLVLLDGDYAGVTAEEQYNEKFGKIVEDRIHSLKDVSSTWAGKTTEGLFSEAEKLRVINSLYPKQKTYSKEKFNLAIQNLLYQKMQLNFSEQTKNRFIKISKHLENKLKAQKK